MLCGCVPIIVDPPQNCTNCLIVRDLRFPCYQGPLPCGGVNGTIVVDLSQYNDVTACTGVINYTLQYFDPVGLMNVSLSAAGVLSAETTSTFTPYAEYEIRYKVTCSNSILSAEGSVYVCMQNSCPVCPPGEYCDPCTASCTPVPPEVLLTSNTTLT